jgi:hypothetical protein
MSDQQFTKGQRVKVEYEGTVSDSNGRWVFVVPDGGNPGHLACSTPESAITALGPSGWPPQTGDIWKTTEGEWFARESEYMVPAAPHVPHSFGEFRDLNPTLVRRRDSASG